MTTCPYCAEEIKPEAIKCRFCGSRLSSGASGELSLSAGSSVAVATRQTTGNLVANTSGQGKTAVLPPGVARWSWGGFCLNWIWAIGNNTWIGLLALIPYVGFIMAIVLGIKGREWAWQNKRWESLEEFNRVQLTWSKWGVGLSIVGLIGWLLVAVAAGTGASSYGTI